MRIDCHVHIVGDGTLGSGCWLKLKSYYHRFLARLMLKSLNIPSSAIGKDLDQRYLNCLIQMVRDSSLDKVIILAQDLPYFENGQPIEDFGSFFVPNDYVLKLAREHDCFLPAASIHPARSDAIDELYRVHNLGAVMLKILPNCHNINCNDPRYKKFWQTMADLRMPLLAHTGGELSVPVVNRAYQNPEILRLPLECGVNVIAAHAGTSSHPLDSDYTNTFIEMLSEYQNLYGDNSALNTPFRCAHYHKLLEPNVQQRIIHGSDFPIPVSGFWPKLRGQLSKGHADKAKKEQNFIERDAIIKNGLGFNPQSFTRLATDILRIA